MFKLREAMRANGLYTLIIDEEDIVNGEPKTIGTYRVARMVDFHTKHNSISILDYTTLNKEVSESVKTQLTKILEFIEGGFNNESSGLY